MSLKLTVGMQVECKPEAFAQLSDYWQRKLAGCVGTIISLRADYALVEWSKAHRFVSCKTKSLIPAGSRTKVSVLTIKRGNRHMEVLHELAV